MKVSCGLFTNIAPLYSRALWYQLSESVNVDYYFYSSMKGFSGIETIDINESRSVDENGRLNWFFLNNFFIRNILFYQTGIISACIRTNYDVYILYGEMHCLSNWLAAFICKARKKPLLFWGHGLYGKEKGLKKFLRVVYYKIAEYNLVYGNRSRDLMIKSGFNPDEVITVYNSLDFNNHKRIYERENKEDLEKLRTELFPDSSHLPVIIFIGRLTKEKKISLLLEAISISKKKGRNYNCIIVGGGIEAENLRQLSVSLSISDNVCFYGPSFDEIINSRLIMLSECCVSPGNVGLTAVHSLSLGTPVITHNNMLNQGPEVEAVIQGETGSLFEENNADNLSEVIDDYILSNGKVTMETNCIEQVSKLWNPKNQRIIFDKAILNSVRN